MKNKITDKNWDILGSKVSEYTPDEFSTNDWEAMDSILNANAAIGPHFLKTYIPIALSASILIAVFVLINTIYRDGKPTELSLETTNRKARGGQQYNSTPNRGEANATMLNIEDIESNEQLEKANLENSSDRSILENKMRSIKEVNNKAIHKVANINLEIASLRSYNNKYSNNLSFPISKSKKSNNDNFSPSNPIALSLELAVENEQSKIGANSEPSDQETGSSNTTSSSNDKVKEIKNIPALALNTLELQYDDRSFRFNEMISVVDVDKRVKFGLLIGLNNSITDYTALTTSHKPFFGIYAKKRLSKKWTLQLEMHYKTVDNYDLEHQFSVSYYDNLGFSNSTTAIREFKSYKSIDIPLTLKFRTSNKLSLVGGLRYSDLQPWLRYSRPDLQPSFSNSSPDQGFWRHDFCIVMGGEYQLLRHWSLALRWNQGVRDITPDNLYRDAEGNIDDSYHFNSDIQLSINYTF